MSELNRDEFFAGRKDWARYKHAILGKYMKIWVYHLQRKSDVLCYVDTCAGEGRYDDGSPGSPLLAAAHNAFLADRGKRLVVYACEENSESIQRLRITLADYVKASPPTAMIIEGKFEDHLSSIVERTRTYPTFFFIDPYGMKSLTADVLEPILADRRDSTEVLVRVDPILLARFAGWLRQGHNGKSPRTSESFRNLLERFRIDPELIEEVELGGKDESIDYKAMMASYSKLFASRFRYIEFIPIRPAWGAFPKYYLLFCTDSDDGLIRMNDVISTTQDELFDDTLRRNSREQPSLFEAVGYREKRPIPDLRDAEKYVLATVQTNREPTYNDICLALVFRFRSDFRQKEHNQAIQNLTERGYIQKEKPELPANKRKYQRYVLGSNWGKTTV